MRDIIDIVQPLFEAQRNIVLWHGTSESVATGLMAERHGAVFLPNVLHIEDYGQIDEGFLLERTVNDNAREFGLWLGRIEREMYPDEPFRKYIVDHDYTDDDQGRALRYRLLIRPKYMEFLKEITPKMTAKGWHLTVISKRNGKLWQLVFEPILAPSQPKLQGGGVYWHLTPVANVENVLQKGLEPRMSRYGFSYPQGRIYLIKSRGDAERMATSLSQRDKKKVEYALLRVTLKGTKGVTVHTDPELKQVAVYTTQPIPASMIKLDQTLIKEATERVGNPP
jgi:hypothetical protein